MTKRPTLRDYVSSEMGPLMVAINRSLNDSESFIQTEANASATSAGGAAASATAAASSLQQVQTLSAQVATNTASASQSAQTAQQAMTAVVSIMTTLNAVWLGAAMNDPTVDNNGNPLVSGAMYLCINPNSASYNVVRVYASGVWEDLSSQTQNQLTYASVSASQAATSAKNAAASAAAALLSQQSAQQSAASAAASAASILNLIPLPNVGNFNNFLRVRQDGTGYELQTAAQALNDLGAAPLDSAQLTGVPVAPTAAKNATGNQLATLNYVLNQAGSVLPLTDSPTGSIGTSYQFARQDHAHPTDSSRAAVGGSASQPFSGSLFKAGWGVPGNGTPAGGFTFSNDIGNDTGMFSDADGAIYFYNNGVRSIVIDNAGNTTHVATATFANSVSFNNGMILNGSQSQVALFTRSNTNALYVQSGTKVFSFDGSGNANVPNAVNATSVNTSGPVVSSYASVTGTPGVGQTTGITQGSILAWNTLTGDGATDFINFSGLGSGGFKWFNSTAGGWQATTNPTPIMSLDATGRLTVATLSATNSISVPHDTTSSLGQIDLFAATPTITFHYNNAISGNVLMSNSEDGLLGLRYTTALTNFAAFGTTKFNLSYGTNGSVVFSGQNDGTLRAVQTLNNTSTTLFNISANGSTYNTPTTFNQSLTAGGALNVTGLSTFNSNVYIAGNSSIRATDNNSHLTVETTGRFVFWDNNGNLALAMFIGSADTNKSINVNVPTTFNSSAPVSLTKLNFTNGGTSSISQDANTSNIVLTTNNGSSPIRTILGSDGTFSPVNINASGYSQAARFAAAPGTITSGSPVGFGYSFINDGNNDTGMFSDGDGHLYLYRNGAQMLSLTDQNFNITASAALLSGGDMTIVNRRLRTPTGSNMLFENGGNLSFWDKNGNSVGYFDLTGAGTGFTLNTPLITNNPVQVNNNFSVYGKLSYISNAQSTTPYISMSPDATGALNLYSWASQTATTASNHVWFDNNCAFHVGDLYGAANVLNLHYGPNNLYRLTGNIDGSLAGYVDSASGSGTASSQIWSISPIKFTMTTPSQFSSTLNVTGLTTLTGGASLNSDLYMNGTSIRTTPNNARLNVESNGRFTFWDNTGALMMALYSGSGDINKSISITVPTNFSSNATVSLGTISFINGGQSAIYQDANTSNIVFSTGAGSSQVHSTLNSTGVLNLTGVTASGTVSSNLMLAAAGLPSSGSNSTGGYSFSSDTGYDTGLFSSGDGTLFIYRNSVPMMSFFMDNRTTVNTLMDLKGDVIANGRRIWAGSNDIASSNSNMLFDTTGHITVNDNSNNTIWNWNMSDGSGLTYTQTNYPLYVGSNVSVNGLHFNDGTPIGSTVSKSFMWYNQAAASVILSSKSANYSFYDNGMFESSVVHATRFMASNGLPTFNTAVAYGYSFYSDSGADTGLFSLSDGYASLYSNSTEALTISPINGSTPCYIQTKVTLAASSDIVMQTGANIFLRAANNTVNTSNGSINQSSHITYSIPARSTAGSSSWCEEKVGTEFRHCIQVSTDLTTTSPQQQYTFHFSQTGRIDAANYNTVNADIAEKYTSNGHAEGSLVMISSRDDVEIELTTGPKSNYFGVISTAPGVTLNSGLVGGQYVALAGRVPTLIIGPVTKGQPITLSSTPGVGQVGTGRVIGFALQSQSDPGVKLVEIALGGSVDLGS